MNDMATDMVLARECLRIANARARTGRPVDVDQRDDLVRQWAIIGRSVQLQREADVADGLEVLFAQVEAIRRGCSSKPAESDQKPA